MNYYVNSGNTLTHNGLLMHSGTKLGSEMVDMLKSNKRLAELIEKKVIVEKEVTLDRVVDSKTGSKNLNRVTVPKSEPKVEREPATEKG